MNNGVIFDVGSNVGDWSKFVIEEYYDISYRLHVFEPLLTAFNPLKNNINKTEKVFLYQMGFGDKQEELKMCDDDCAQGSASLLTKTGNIIEDVYIDTIDNFCKQNDINSIDFLKMDVQGYEYNILMGAKDMLNRGKIKNIQFEFDEPNIKNRVFFMDFWDLLSDDYRIFHSLYNGLVEVKEYHYELENFRCMNYLAVRK